MLPTEHSLIVASLDENWRTVVEIRSRLGGHTRSVSQLAATLRGLSDAGYIERVERETPAPKRERHGLVGRLSIVVGEEWPFQVARVFGVAKSAARKRRNRILSDLIRRRKL